MQRRRRSAEGRGQRSSKQQTPAVLPPEMSKRICYAFAVTENSVALTLFEKPLGVSAVGSCLGKRFTCLLIVGSVLILQDTFDYACGFSCGARATPHSVTDRTLLGAHSSHFGTQCGYPHCFETPCSSLSMTIRSKCYISPSVWILQTVDRLSSKCNTLRDKDFSGS